MYTFFTDVSFLASFGGGNGSILLDNVACTGDEQRLDECANNGFGHHDCYDDHSEDAGVICTEGTELCCLLHNAAFE